MSDDFVERLRDLGDRAAFEPHMHHEAADRIKELEAALKDMAKYIWRGDWDKLAPETRAILEQKK